MWHVEEAVRGAETDDFFGRTLSNVLNLSRSKDRHRGVARGGGRQGHRHGRHGEEGRPTREAETTAGANLDTATTAGTDLAAAPGTNLAFMMVL